ncbi:MAG: UDP-N-acetylmuramoyl-L-alanyl-D-glutamate--2,6-diaminopimelate ligase [Alphaproteobacteria bacterium]
MRLEDLMTEGIAPAPGQAPDMLAREIEGLTPDSRHVREGWLFAAIPGTQADGARFIPDALEAGASAILTAEGVSLPRKSYAAHLTCANPRRALALMADRFFAAQPETVVAVTGTNGKTSVAGFVRQLWEALGIPAASLGTLGVIASGDAQPLPHTTPDAVVLHSLLAGLKARGFEHLALEASSHGLEQHRLDGVRVAAAAFTNLSRDHLDYHADEAAYLAAKLRLFTEVMAADGTAVLNADTDVFGPVAEAARARGLTVMDVGRTGTALRLAAQEPSVDGQRLSVETGGKAYEIRLPLVGAFQASNALLAAGLVIATGAEARDVLPCLEGLRGAPGRMEQVARTGNGASVVVDYAHTPDALKTVLEALRPHVRGQLAVVFGCGGDRDRGKRPEMGRVAAQLADRVIVTDDNPRTEDPAAIRREIMSACPGAREIGGRAAAIEEAITTLKEGDILVVAGKGHETGQIVGGTVHPFSDADAVRTAAQMSARV